MPSPPPAARRLKTGPRLVYRSTRDLWKRGIFLLLWQAPISTVTILSTPHSGQAPRPHWLLGGVIEGASRTSIRRHLRSNESAWCGCPRSHGCEDCRHYRQRRKNRHQGSTGSYSLRAGRDRIQQKQSQQSLGRSAFRGPSAGQRRIRRLRNRNESCGRNYAAGRPRPASRCRRHSNRLCAQRILRLC